jgi:lipopolysaccharide/colanic/teichoic acid biosynthesis glycosyltransferase
MQQNSENNYQNSLKTVSQYNYTSYSAAETLETLTKPAFWYKNFEKRKLHDFLLTSYQIPEVINFILQHAPDSSNNIFCINNPLKLNFIYSSNSYFISIINLISLNHINQLNRFLTQANFKLAEAGTLIGSFEVKQNLLSNSKPFSLKTTNVLNKIIFRKNLSGTKYKNLTKAEAFGRLFCNGFEIIAEQLIGNHIYFVAAKKKKPAQSIKKQDGFFIKLPRIVKDKQVKYFYKLRTMHPYSEFLQEYMVNEKGLENGGKISADFRVLKIGKILRKYWLDELPMLYNLLKGDIKLVGVRPLSPQYFNLYSKELQELRVKTKPGLIPPFYVDFPKTFQEIMLSELVYLEQYRKNPLITDTKYFFKAVFNILFKGYRSK